ncbi:MAG: hypothetical protein ABH934_01025 [Chloroflexota bacterium]
MKNKPVLLLITGLLVIVLGLTACGRTSVPGDRVNTIPHDVGWGFTNCLVCHASGDIALPAIFHPTNPTNEDCLTPGCHVVATPTQTIITPATSTPPVSTPPVSTPPVSTPPVSTPPVSTPPVSTPPVSTPPVSTPPTSTPPTSTPPVSTPPVSTPPVSTPPVSTAPNISVEWHPTLTDTSLCFVCHGAGAAYPYTEDHEGRANDSCLDGGCHEFEQK